jgi:5-methylcytosine-specific restriction protein A
MEALEVPSTGPLTLGAVYQRLALHDRFGGNKTAGIVPSASEPTVLLFHTEETAQQFYGDGFDEDGIYWYSGMGAEGDMDWNYANRAVRDHLADGRDLLLFERFKRKGGYWLYSHLMHCVGWKLEKRPDRTGKLRQAIVFGLASVDEPPAVESLPADSSRSLAELRQLALAAPPTVSTAPRTTVAEVHLRSSAVRLYALARAGGVCEACLIAAPFVVPSGKPFLEVHHIDRLADGGPDRPERVAGICPNCHRRCHYAIDARDYNQRLRAVIAEKERQFQQSSA